jgi:hypothetical protein
MRHGADLSDADVGSAAEVLPRQALHLHRHRRGVQLRDAIDAIASLLLLLRFLLHLTTSEATPQERVRLQSYSRRSEQK